MSYFLAMLAFGALGAAMLYGLGFISEAMTHLREENALFLALPQLLLVKAVLIPELRLCLRRAFSQAHEDGDANYAAAAASAHQTYKKIITERRSDAASATSLYFRFRA